MATIAGSALLATQGIKADSHQVMVFNQRRGNALEKIAQYSKDKWAREFASDMLWREDLSAAQQATVSEEKA